MKKAKTKNREAQTEFSGLNEADVSGNKRKLLDGDTIFKVNNCLRVDGEYGLTYVIEGEIISSDNPGNVPGREASATITGLSKLSRRDNALGRLKAFLSACVGADNTGETPIEGETWESLCAASLGTDQPLKGSVIKVTLETVPTKGKFMFPAFSFNKIEATE
jgi:hypothetical protein